MSQLRQYFPFILTRDEIQQQIADCPEWQETFNSWKKEEQESFLQICSGEKGPMMLSDTMFKEMMSPEKVPGRLEDFLTAVLGMSVRVVRLLPNEEHSIEDNYSLLVFDILVELEDGSLANVEMQRMGYFFPGQLSAGESPAESCASGGSQRRAEESSFGARASRQVRRWRT